MRYFEFFQPVAHHRFIINDQDLFFCHNLQSLDLAGARIFNRETREIRGSFPAFVSFACFAVSDKNLRFRSRRGGRRSGHWW